MSLNSPYSSDTAVQKVSISPEEFRPRLQHVPAQVASSEWQITSFCSTVVVTFKNLYSNVLRSGLNHDRHTTAVTNWLSAVYYTATMTTKLVEFNNAQMPYHIHISQRLSHKDSGFQSSECNSRRIRLEFADTIFTFAVLKQRILQLRDTDASLFFF